MKRYGIIITVLAATLIATAEAQQRGETKARSAELVLLVGPHEYEVVVGEPVTILTPGGEQVTIVVRQKQTLHYSNSDLSFDYPRQLQLSTDKQTGVDMIYLRSRGTPLAVIQSYSVPTSPAQVRRELVLGMTEQLSAGGARFVPGSGRMTQANIGGSSRSGQLLDYQVQGVPMKTEIYAFRHGQRVVALVIQYANGDAEAAGPMFSVVTSSFR